MQEIGMLESIMLENRRELTRSDTHHGGTAAEAPAGTNRAPHTDPATLPFVDISLLNGSAAERAQMASGLRAILHHFGFFYLRGHGVDPALCSAALAISKQFFALPEADKLAISMTKSPHFRGYCRAGLELTAGAQDWREQVDFDREEAAVLGVAGAPSWRRVLGPNQWPDALPEMRQIILDYQAEVTLSANPKTCSRRCTIPGRANI
jgi:isopenicillin N synthase-like dioxygenase